MGRTLRITTALALGLFLVGTLLAAYYDLVKWAPAVFLATVAGGWILKLFESHPPAQTDERRLLREPGKKVNDRDGLAVAKFRV